MRAFAGTIAVALSCCAGALAALSCREVITYDNSPPPGSGAPITWEPIGPPGEAILALRFDQAGILYAGSESGRLFRSVTDGDQWVPVLLPVSDGAITSILVDPVHRIYVANDIHGVFLSDDGGAAWARINEGLTDTSIYAMTFVAGGTLIAGSARGIVSFLGPTASAWEERLPIARPVTSLQAVSSQEIFGSAWGSGIFRFGPFDSTAVLVNTGLPELYINAVYVGPAGYLFAGTRSSGAFRTDPGLIFWQEAGGGSISPEVIVFRTSSFGELFAGTTTGVYLSTDQGLGWTHLDGGIGTREVRALAVNAEATVFAGTAEGVYRSVRKNGGTAPAGVSGASSPDRGNIPPLRRP